MKKTSCKGSGYGYLGHFGQQKFINAGHNTSSKPMEIVKEAMSGTESDSDSSEDSGATKLGKAAGAAYKRKRDKDKAESMDMSDSKVDTSKKVKYADIGNPDKEYA